MNPSVFEDQDFKQKNYADASLPHAEYLQCRFLDCDFSNASLLEATFAECEFISCNFSMASLKNTSFREAQFKQCKLIGVDFSLCKPFLLSFSFDECQMDYSSFSGLHL